jgi:hypothetical protein
MCVMSMPHVTVCDQFDVNVNQCQCVNVCDVWMKGLRVISPPHRAAAPRLRPALSRSRRLPSRFTLYYLGETAG